MQPQNDTPTYDVIIQTEAAAPKAAAQPLAQRTVIVNELLRAMATYGSPNVRVGERTIHVPTFVEKLSQPNFGSPRLHQNIPGRSIQQQSWRCDLEAQTRAGVINNGPGLPLVVHSDLLLMSAYMNRGLNIQLAPQSTGTPGTTTSFGFELPGVPSGIPAGAVATVYAEQSELDVFGFFITANQRYQFATPSVSQTFGLTLSGVSRSLSSTAARDAVATPFGAASYAADFVQSYTCQFENGSFEGLFLFGRNEWSGDLGQRVLTPLKAGGASIRIDGTSGTTVNRTNPSVAWTGLTDGVDTITVQALTPGDYGFNAVFGSVLPTFGG
jgi:hypothetical protein